MSQSIIHTTPYSFIHHPPLHRQVCANNFTSVTSPLLRTSFLPGHLQGPANQMPSADALQQQNWGTNNESTSKEDVVQHTTLAFLSTIRTAEQLRNQSYFAGYFKFVAYYSVKGSESCPQKLPYKKERVKYRKTDFFQATVQTRLFFIFLYLLSLI